MQQTDKVSIALNVIKQLDVCISPQNNCFYIHLSLIHTEVFHLYFLVKPLISLLRLMLFCFQRQEIRLAKLYHGMTTKKLEHF